MGFQAHAAPPSQYPTAALPGATISLAADSGIGVNVGAAVPVWRDGSGNGRDFSPVGGAAAPVLRVDDDLLPYVEFDGLAAGLASALLPAFVGLHLTLYAVARCNLGNPTTGNGNKLLALGRAAQIAGLSAGTVSIDRRANAELNYRFGGVGDCGDGTIQSGLGVNVGSWEVLAIRAGVRGQNSFVSCYRSGLIGWGMQWGLVPTPLPARNYSRASLGFDHGTGGDFLPCDIRAFALYNGVGHPDVDVKNMMRYLAHKWKVGVLD